MANQFHYYRQGDCPICGGAGHKSNKVCRSTTTDDGRIKVHCWGGGDALKGWGYVGDDTHGMAQYIEGWGDRRDMDRDARERKATAARAQAEKERLGRSLTIERDATYRKWQDNQRLNQRDRDELTRRGLLPNEIQLAQELGWLRRWEKGSQLFGPANIPGVNHWGLGGQSGLAIAAPNSDGLIAGFQVKPDSQGDGPKYRWLAGCALRNNEQPIPVFQHPDRRGDVEIWITEGFLKALVTAFLAWRLGLTHVVVVGCGGSNWASAPAQWERTLQRLNPTAIYLLPDAGAAQNENILGQADRLRSLLRGLGHTLKFKWWGQFDKSGKGNLDPDEVPTQTIIDAPALPAIPAGAIQLWSETPQRQALLVPGVGMPLLYEPGDRQRVWEGMEDRAIASGQSLVVLDTSEAGSGKSRDAGIFLHNAPNGTQRVFASQEYRNPSDPTIDALPELEAKHLGLVGNDIDGRYIRRTPKAGEEPNIEPSCAKAPYFHKAHSMGVQAIAGADCHACRTCPMADITYREGEVVALTCQHLNRKRATKDTPAYRCHPSTIAKPSERYDSQTVIIDEATPALSAVQSQSFSPNDLAQDFQALKVTAPEPAAIIEPLVDADILALHKLSASKDPEDYYGLSSYALMESQAQAVKAVESQLEASPHFDYISAATPWEWLAKRLDKATRTLPDHHLGSTLEEHLWALDNLARARFFGERLRATTGQHSRATLPRTNIANGDRPATLQLSNANARTKAQFKTANRLSILLDATGSPAHLRRITGQPVFWIQQRRSQFPNLTIKLITGTDKLKVNREQSTRDRARLLAQRVADAHQGQSIGLIDYQRYRDDYDGLGFKFLSRFVESRGTNRAKDLDAIALMGVGVSNLGQLAIQYELLHRCTIADLAHDRRFLAWVRRRSLDLTVQEISRLRAQWSSTSQTVYVAGASKTAIARLQKEFPGATVEVVDVMRISPQSATEKAQRTANAVIDSAITTAKDTGVMPSQQALAKATGRSLSTVQRAVKSVCGQGYRAFSKVVKRLLETINSGLTTFQNSLELETLRQELDAIGCGHFFGSANALETMATLEEHFKNYGQAQFLRAIEGVSTYGRAGIDRAIAAAAVDQAITAPKPVLILPPE